MASCLGSDEAPGLEDLASCVEGAGRANLALPAWPYPYPFIDTVSEMLGKLGQYCGRSSRQPWTYPPDNFMDFERTYFAPGQKPGAFTMNICEKLRDGKHTRNAHAFLKYDPQRMEPPNGKTAIEKKTQFSASALVIASHRHEPLTLRPEN